MKYEVIRRFRDKYTGEIYLPGDSFKSNETDRINDLINRKLIKEVQQDYNDLTKKELIALLNDKKIKFDAKANKDELIELLKEGG